MSETIFFYMGQNIETMSREELIEAITVLGRSESHYRQQYHLLIDSVVAENPDAPDQKTS